jgi:2-haloacid dehalogenase
MRNQSVHDINAFAFDAYGTLFDVYSVTTLCEEFFPGLGDAVARTWRVKQLQYSVLRTLMGRYQDFWQLTHDALIYACKSVNVVLEQTQRRRLMDAYLTLRAFPDVKPGLLTLKEAGVRLAILSNGEPKMLRAVVDHAGIGSLFDAVISADEVQMFKPAPMVYQLASKHLNLRPAAIGFVSSNSWDVSGAGSAGLTTIWMRRDTEQVADELGDSPAATVGEIADLVALVRR